MRLHMPYSLLPPDNNWRESMPPSAAAIPNCRTSILGLFWLTAYRLGRGQKHSRLFRRTEYKETGQTALNFYMTYSVTIKIT